MTQTPTSPLRVVVIDDFLDSADGFGMLVTALGHQCRTAYSGMEGIHEVENFNPHVVFMDIRMPQMDGIEAAHLIRQNPKLQNVTLVAVTVLNKEEVGDAPRSNVFDDVLVKPVDGRAVERLLSSIKAR